MLFCFVCCRHHPTRYKQLCAAYFLHPGFIRYSGFYYCNQQICNKPIFAGTHPVKKYWPKCWAVHYHCVIFSIRGSAKLWLQAFLICPLTRPGSTQPSAAGLAQALAAAGNVTCLNGECVQYMDISQKFNVKAIPCKNNEKLGIALDTLGKFPINGLRHKPENGTCGWYIWCGETMSKDPSFFKSLHVSHINDYLPQIEQYLSLPPGYRFLLASNHEDVWYDSTLIGT